LFLLSLAAMAWGPRGSMRTPGRSRTIFAAFLAACGIFAHWSISFVNAWTARPGSSSARGLPARAAGGAAAEVAKDGQIFVSIAAYADPELPATMQSLIAAASRPELIRFGIVWQGPGSGLEPLDMEELANLWNLSSYAEDRVVEHLELPDDASLPIWEMMGGRIRSLRMTPEAARGPCWARYLAQLLWSGEELYLQLDSHMRFVPGWDDKAREELAWCGRHSEKPVLCTYGPGYSLGTPYSEIPKGNVPVSMNCANTFDSDGILLIKARELKAPLPEPTKHYFWGAQFSFSSAEVLCEVPYDPQLQMLFFGEEISMAVRLYTHGWDVYAPKENLFFHLWERDYRRVYWKDNRALFASLLKASQCRLHGLLDSSVPGDGRAWPLPGGLRSRGDAFGLGSQRPLEAYEAEAGVHFKGKSLQAPALRGGGDALSEDHFLEPAIQAREAIELSGAVEELSFLSGVPFVADAAVNGAPSYVAHVQGDEMHRFVLWYSSTNRTWIVNSGGVAHGLGQEAVPLIFSEAGIDTPVDANRWYYFDDFMGGWIPSRTMKFCDAHEEARDDAEAEGSWLDAVASLASPLIPRYQ